jgi:hypothetical protein
MSQETGKESSMYNQSKNWHKNDYFHWRNQERLKELEQLLESDYLAYIDPIVAEDMKRIIRHRKNQIRH